MFLHFRFSLDIKPLEGVSEYTATVAYNLLNEGKDGRQKVDTLNMILRAEGTSVRIPKIIKCSLCYNIYFILYVYFNN